MKSTWPAAQTTPTSTCSTKHPVINTSHAIQSVQQDRKIYVPKSHFNIEKLDKTFFSQNDTYQHCSIKCDSSDSQNIKRIAEELGIRQGHPILELISRTDVALFEELFLNNREVLEMYDKEQKKTTHKLTAMPVNEDTQEEEVDDAVIIGEYTIPKATGLSTDHHKYHSREYAQKFQKLMELQQKLHKKQSRTAD
jgi:hypothetical protein